MPDSVLRTKLHRPETGGELVCRPRLHALLDAGLAGPLTLISAPAGYGKTTLLSQWLESRPEKSAWVSLDERDSDARAFLQYLVAAVRTACPEACAETYDLLAVPNPVPVSVLLRSLTNELDVLEQRLILVLDDYHDLRLPEAHDLINDLLRHPPSALHLVISARRDPPLDLVALRAQNRLSELRMEDLAFTATETAQFLEQVLGGAPGDAAIANVQRQFEGWAVGLRLAALAARGRDRTNSFIAELHGDSIGVRDYLLREVVAAQPANVQTCLRKLSVPNRFNAALCEHLCTRKRARDWGLMVKLSCGDFSVLGCS